VQRFWRGYVAREIAGDRREELLLFLEALKREEAKTMEDEYYKLNPLELLKKQMREHMVRGVRVTMSLFRLCSDDTTSYRRSKRKILIH